jgi:hypothetical protein
MLRGRGPGSATIPGRFIIETSFGGASFVSFGDPVVVSLLVTRKQRQDRSNAGWSKLVRPIQDEVVVRRKRLNQGWHLPLAQGSPQTQHGPREARARCKDYKIHTYSIHSRCTLLQLPFLGSLCSPLVSGAKSKMLSCQKVTEILRGILTCVA